jgi:hypothetical protein
MIERFDDGADTLTQGRIRLDRRGQRGKCRGAPLSGAMQHGGPETVGVAELVLHGAPGGADVLGDAVGRNRARLARGQRPQRRLEHALASCVATPVGASADNSGTGSLPSHLPILSTGCTRQASFS